MSAHPPYALVAINVDRDHQGLIASSIWSMATIEFIHDQEIDRYLGDRCRAAAFLIALAPARQQLDMGDVIRQVRRAWRATPIIAYSSVDDEWAPRAVRAIQCGADHLALHGFDDLRRVVDRALRTVTAAPACETTLRLVLPWVPRPAHRIVEFCILHASKTISVLDVAAHVGRTARHVNRQLHATRLPPIAATISWCRLFVAAYLMSRENERVDAVAGVLGYGSGAALRDMLRRYTGWRTAAARDPDAVGQLARLYGAPLPDGKRPAEG